MSQTFSSKYSRVSVSSLQNALSNALTKVSGFESKVSNIKSDLSNQAILPVGISNVSLTAINFVMNSTSGTGSVAVLKKKLTILKDAASRIKQLQAKEKTYKQLLVEIERERRRQDDDDYDRSYYRRLLRRRDSLVQEMRTLESSIDSKLSNF